MIRFLACSLALSLLVACSGAQSLLPRQSDGGSTSTRRAGLTLRIHIPKRKHERHRHGPSYISPATQGMTIAISGPIPVNLTVALTPTASGCSTNGSGTTCQVTMDLMPCKQPTNCYTATFATYDEVACSPNCSIPTAAKELSAAQNVTFTIAAGKNNVVNVVLGGYPAGITVSPLLSGYLQGNAQRLQLWGAAPQKLNVVALDADGNAIVGPGAPTVSASSSSATLNVTPPTAASPNTVALAAATTGSPPVVTPGMVNLSVSVTPPADSGASKMSITVPVAIAHSAVYAALSTNVINVYYDGNATTSPNLSIFGPQTQLDDIEQLTVDANSNLYATNEFVSGNSPGSILEFPAGSTGNVKPSFLVSSSSSEDPYGVAVGPNGTMYVTDADNDNVSEYPPSSNGTAVIPSNQITGAGTGLDSPLCEALDANGTLYVANFGAGVTEYAAGSTGNAAPVTLTANFHSPLCVAVDGNGILYVSDETPSITEFAPGASGSATPIAQITGPLTFLPASPYALAVDAAGTIYVGGSNSDYVTEYAAGSNGSATPSGAIPTSANVFAVYAVPAPSVNVITP
jgi:hypothetical protein